MARGQLQVRWRVTLRDGQNSAPLLPTGPRAARTDVERWMDKSRRSSDAPIEELGQHVDGQREYNGGVLLRTYCAQSLEVAQLQRERGLVDHVSGLLQRSRGLLLAFGSNYL